MSLADETRWMDATAQAELVASGRASARELTEAAIERIEADDGPAPSGLNAVTLRWFDHARDIADAIDADAQVATEAPFRGVPFLLKDLFAAYAGQTCSYGNVALKEAGVVAAHDDNVVSRFKEAGLITLGRTASPEMGSIPVTETKAWGATRNPWNLDRTPGGSSGGAAAAVADRNGADRSRIGWRRLNPHPGRQLRTGRAQNRVEVRITSGPGRSEAGLAVDFVLTRTVRDSAPGCSTPSPVPESATPSSPRFTGTPYADLLGRGSR